MDPLTLTVEGSYESFRERAARVIQSLEDVGVAVPASSQFQRYIAEVNRIIARGSWRRSVDRDIFHQANLELEDLEFILLTADADTVPSFKPHLQAIVSGHVSPREERNSSARDYQFELLIAATLKSNGAVVRFAEPDVVFEIEGVSYGVAAKRLKSKQKLGKNLREAEKQMASAGLQGVIAIDLGIIFNPQNTFIRADTFSAGSELVGTWLRDFMRVNRQHMIKDIRPAATLGVMGYVAAMVEDLSVPRLGTTRHSTLLSLRPETEEKLKPFYRWLSRSTAMKSAGST